MSRCARLLFCAAVAAAAPRPAAAAERGTLRLGIVGLDTSHVVVFTRLLNDAAAGEHVAGARVVAAYKGGSPDIPSSASRLETYTTELRDRWGVEIVPDIAALCSRVDAVLLESVDGRTHLEQVRPVVAAGKRVFIDKPIAASYDEARAIARLARDKGVAWFSSSSLRFSVEARDVRTDPKLGGVLGAEAYSPAPLEPHHPDLFWYGIHGVELLYTVMGPGCESVVRMHTPGGDVVVGRWRDGRLGTFRGIRDGKSGYGVTVFGRDAIRSTTVAVPYRALVEEIVKFFQTGVPPVPSDETLEIYAFMEAADRSKARGGAVTPLPTATDGGR